MTGRSPEMLSPTKALRRVLTAAAVTAISVVVASPASTAQLASEATVAGDLISSVELVGPPAIGGTLQAKATPPIDTTTQDVTYRFVWRDGDVELTNTSGHRCFSPGRSMGRR